MRRRKLQDLPERPRPWPLSLRGLERRHEGQAQVPGEGLRCGEARGGVASCASGRHATRRSRATHEAARGDPAGDEPSKLLLHESWQPMTIRVVRAPLGEQGVEVRADQLVQQVLLGLAPAEIPGQRHTSRSHWLLEERRAGWHRPGPQGPVQRSLARAQKPEWCRISAPRGARASFFAGTARLSRHGTRAFCEVPLAGAVASAPLVSHASGDTGYAKLSRNGSAISRTQGSSACLGARTSEATCSVALQGGDQVARGDGSPSLGG
jgi:hypothetical protein